VEIHKNSEKFLKFLETPENSYKTPEFPRKFIEIPEIPLFRISWNSFFSIPEIPKK
jgi:hypothetical protein